MNKDYFKVFAIKKKKLLILDLLNIEIVFVFYFFRFKYHFAKKGRDNSLFSKKTKENI